MTTPDAGRNPEDYCYRHPDRRSFVLCQRCLRTVCPECQTQLPVGVICPECLAQQQDAATASQRKAQRAARRSGVVRAVAVRDGRPLTTYWLVGLTAVVFVVTLIPGFGDLVQGTLLLFAPYLYPELSGRFEPWRLLTVTLTHSGFWHLGLNMLALWLLGRSLEPLLGHLRFLWLYLLSALGGSVCVALFGFTSPVVGASGAVFGLFGALLVIGRHLGANITGIAVILGINLVLTFLPGLTSALGGSPSIQISWQAHVGGLAVGALVGFIYARTRAIRRRRLQVLLLIAVAVGLLALLIIPALVWG